MEEPFRPPDLAGDAAQQDRRLDGPALQLPALRRRRLELRPHLYWSHRNEGGSAEKREPPQQPHAGRVDGAGDQSPAARRERADWTQLLVGRPAEESVRSD